MTVDDPSGSHPRPATPTAGFADAARPSNNEAVSVKTIVMAALFLVGGAGTGAGTSLLGGNGAREELAKLTEKVDELVRKSDQREGMDGFYRRRTDEHETRLDEVERRLNAMGVKR